MKDPRGHSAAQSHCGILPEDEHNRELLSQTHPHSWKNPTPNGRYNLVAIGGGTAGIISALGAATLGGKAALVERRLLGGDCLNFGCVPSKALIRVARAVHAVRTAGEFGARVSGFDPDFPAAMERLRRLRAQISHHDSAERFTKLGCDVYLGHARFTAADTLSVDGQELRFSRAVIATGARPFVPPIAGLAEAGYFTNETIFTLTELPRRLAVIGGGPIGCELGQAFARFGAEVHLIEQGAQLLGKEDEDAAAVVAAQFVREGIHLHLEVNVLRVESLASEKIVVIEQAGSEQRLAVDAILLVIGRVPNTEGLGLDAAGVESGEAGVVVDDHLRTTNRRVFAAGDVCTQYRFTHAADAMARICVQNALFPLFKKRFSRLVIPRVTYTDPEVATVGLTAREAAEQGIEIDTYHEDLAAVDRAVVDGEAVGFAKIHCKKGTGKVVGATLVSSHAGESIGEITLLMTSRKKLGTLAATIHSYPTQVEVFKRIADQYTRTRLTPSVAKILRKWLAWRRG